MHKIQRIDNKKKSATFIKGQFVVDVVQINGVNIHLFL